MENPDLNGITIKGVPILEVIDLQERKEIRAEAVQEANKFKNAIPRRRGSIRFKPQDEKHGAPVAFKNADEAAYLLERGGVMSMKDARKKNKAILEKWARLRKLIRALPSEDFIEKDVRQVIIQATGMSEKGDTHRYLNMLLQGGFLSVEDKNVKPLVYAKTDLCKLSDEELMREFKARNHLMIGNAPTRKAREIEVPLSVVESEEDYEPATNDDVPPGEAEKCECESFIDPEIMRVFRETGRVELLAGIAQRMANLIRVEPRISDKDLIVLVAKYS
jgi:hypothetical protein